jgi:mannose-6-phosphate isomerase-like protein (cupin superfamily)
MNRTFQARAYFTVADGTEVSPFLNATDVMQRDVPWGTLGDMSIAAGRIGPGVTSWIHYHPVVTQVTYVVSGQLVIWMKDPGSARPYDLELQTGMASICERGTLFQLQNTSRQAVEVLYMVSPSYVFEMRDDKVVYDEAVLVAKTWDELAAMRSELQLQHLQTHEILARRSESMLRLRSAKGEPTSSEPDGI